MCFNDIIDKIVTVWMKIYPFRQHWCQTEIMPKTNIDYHGNVKFHIQIHRNIFTRRVLDVRDFFIYTTKMCTYMKIPNLNNCIFYSIPTIFLRRMNKTSFIYIYSLMSVFSLQNKAEARKQHNVMENASWLNLLLSI